jgi:hypothetical protein
MVDDQVRYPVHLIKRGIGIRLANSTTSNVAQSSIAAASASVP